jgi:large repetitive protein
MKMISTMKLLSTLHLAICLWFIGMWATPNALWAQSVGQRVIGNGFTGQTGRAGAAAADGGYVIAGTIESLQDGGRTNVTLTKYGSSGLIQWSKEFQVLGSEEPAAILATSSGQYLITVNTTEPIDSTALSLFSFIYLVDENGGLISLQTASTPGANSGLFKTISTPDGGFASLGYTELGGGSSNILLVKWRAGATGVEWTRSYGSDQPEIPNDFVWGDNAYYVIGIQTDTTTFSNDGLLMRIEANGDLSWSKTYSTGDLPITPTNLISTSIGLIAVGYHGLDLIGQETDLFVSLLAPSGNIVGSQSYVLPGNQYPTSARFGPDGNFYIQGLHAPEVGPQAAIAAGIGGSDGAVNWMNAFNYGDFIGSNSSLSFGTSGFQSLGGNDVLISSTNDTATGLGLQYLLTIDQNGNGGCDANKLVSQNQNLPIEVADATLSVADVPFESVPVPSNVTDVLQTQSDVCTPTCGLTFSAVKLQDNQCFGGNEGAFEVSQAFDGSAEYALNGGDRTPSSLFENLTAGAYQVVVYYGESCIDTVNITIMQPDRRVAYINVNVTNATNAGSNDGAITASIVGGTPSYTTLINNENPQQGASLNLTNLAPAQYILTTFDSLGCIFDTTITVRVAGGCTFEISPNITAPILCNGDSTGQLTIRNIDGRAPIMYSLDNSPLGTDSVFSNLPVGVYTIRAMSVDSCLATRVIVIFEPEVLRIQDISITPPGCNTANGSITLNVQGGTQPYRVIVNGGDTVTTTTFTNLAADTYSFSIIDSNSCAVAAQVVLSDTTNIVYSPIDLRNPTCADSEDGEFSIQVIAGGRPPYEYSIDAGPYQSSNRFFGLSAGNYDVAVRDANQCVSRSVVALMAPVPVVGRLAATSDSCSRSNGTITISSISGGSGVIEYSIDGGENFFNSAFFSNLAGETYNVIARDGNNCTYALGEIEVPFIGIRIDTVIVTGPACGDSTGTGTIEIITSSSATDLEFSITGPAGPFVPINVFAGLELGTYQVFVRSETLAICGPLNGGTFALLPQGNYDVDTILVDNPACAAGTEGGRITVGTVTGGVAPYRYALNNGELQSSQEFDNLATGSYRIVVEDSTGCRGTLGEVEVTVPPALVIDQVIITPASCGVEDGSITIIASGGTGEISYRILGTSFINVNSLPNLPAGNYTVAVRDAAGCITDSTVVLNNSGINLTFLPRAALCFGSTDGQVQVTATGGQAPYTYSITGPDGPFVPENVFNNLAAGIYTIFARDASGCVGAANIQITQPEQIIVNLQIINRPSCESVADGSVTVSAFGGTPPLTYAVNAPVDFVSTPTFSNLRGGENTFYVRDANGCIASRLQRLNAPPAPGLRITTSAQPSCGAVDGSLVVQATGATNLEYSIDGGNNYDSLGTFNNLRAGTYFIAVRSRTAPACVSRDTINLTSAGNFIVQDEIIAPACGASNGQLTVVVDGGNPPYEFSVDGGQTFSADNLFTGLRGGQVVDVIIRDNQNCVDTVSYSIPNLTEIAFDVVPSQPSCTGLANGTLTVNVLQPGNYTYAIIDTNNFVSSNIFTNLTAGNYTVFVRSEDGCTGQQVVVLSTNRSVVIDNISTTDAACGQANGGITVSASLRNIPGGLAFSQNGANWITSTSPYQFTNLSAANYTVFVRAVSEPNCVVTQNVQVRSGGAEFQFNLNITNPSCVNPTGSVLIGVRGATAPVSYSINGGPFIVTDRFDNLLPSTYVLAAQDALGCTDVDTFVIDGFESLQATVDIISRPGCAGQTSLGSVQVRTNGGIAPFRYSINGGTNYVQNPVFTNLIAGTYAIITEDADRCSTIVNFTLEAGTGFVVDEIVLGNPSCGQNDGFIAVSATAEPGDSLGYSIDNINYQDSSTINNLAAGTYTVYVRNGQGCIQQFVSELIATPDFSAQVSSLSPNCPGDGACILVSDIIGGQRPFTYSFNGGPFLTDTSICGITSNFNVVRVRDARNCVFSDDVLIDLPQAIEITTSKRLPSCPGRQDGQIAVNVSGGTAPYSYAITTPPVFGTNSTFPGLASGVYTISIRDANDCVAQIVDTLSIPGGVGLIVDEIVIRRPLCEGVADGLIRVFARGGLKPYSVSLDNGGNWTESTVIESVAVGRYPVLVRDANQCQVERASNVNVTPRQRSVIVNVLANNLNCASVGSDVVINIRPVAPQTYSYEIIGVGTQTSNTFAAVPAGNYNVVVRSNLGCISRSAVTVEAPAPVTIDTVLVTRPNCSYDSTGAITVVASSGSPLRYSLDGINYQDNSMFERLPQGMQMVYVRNQNGCVDSSMITLEALSPVSIEDVVFTGPTCSNSNDVTIVPIVSGGFQRYEYALNGGGFQLDDSYSGLPAGEYRLQVRDARGCMAETTVVATAPAALSVSAQANPASSPTATDGNIRVSADGGEPAYEFRLNQGAFAEVSEFTGLAAGSYLLTARDARGCLVSQTVQVRSNYVGTCPSPGSVTIENVSSNSALIRWNDVQVITTIASYQVRYRIAGTPTWTSVPVNNNFYTISGLAPNTNYEFQVRTNCSAGNNSDYTNLQFVRTTGGCDAPSDLAVEAALTTANVTWTAVAGATEYLVAWRPATGATTWTTAKVSTNSYTIPGLRPNTRYFARVRTTCGTTASTWTPQTSFSTIGAREGMVASTDADFSLSVYPNPNKGQFEIHMNTNLSHEPVQVQLVDVSGKAIFSQSYDLGSNSQSVQVNLNDYAAGVYTLMVTQGQTRKSSRVVLE